MRHLFPSFDRPARVSPYFYVPPKRRWWPLLAAFAAGGVCVLALLDSAPRTEGANVVQKPIVHQVGPGSSTRAGSLPKPTISRTTTAERADAAGVVPPAAEDPVGRANAIAATPQSAQTSATPTAAAAPDAPRSGTAIADTQTATTSAPSASETNTAPTARAKPSARQSSARSSSSRHAGRKSRRHEPAQD